MLRCDRNYCGEAFTRAEALTRDPLVGEPYISCPYCGGQDIVDEPETTSWDDPVDVPEPEEE